MLYKFKSKATGDLIMLEPQGKHILKLIGKEASAKGIILPTEMLAAIDFNAGGKIIAADREPTDMDLMSNLANKIMFVRQRVWKSGDKQGNWIDAVQGKGTVQPKTSAPVTQQQEPPLQQEDEDLAF